MASVSERTVTVAGAPLSTRAVGQGPPVLLTHGVPGDVDTLAPVADRLAESYRAITVSLRYAGPGPHGQRGFGSREQRDDLHDLIDALGLGPVHLVAWSYSAHAALGLAAEHPQQVRSLFVYEPGFATFVDDANDLQRVQQDQGAAFGPVFEALGDSDLPEALRRSIDAAAGAPGWFNQQPARVRAIHQRTAHLLPLLLTQSAPLPLDRHSLGSIRCPTSVAWGEGTRDCYRIVAQWASRLVPGARAIVAAGAGHLLPEADPSAFAAELMAHLDWSTERQALERP